MTSFDEREKAFEAKYRLDQETAFKVNVRRNKLLGRWVAEQFGLSGTDAEAYARSVVEADFAEPGDEDVVRKVMADVAARGHDLTEDRLRKQLDKLAATAREEILKELGKDPGK
ncbi:MAG: DUF1476 domain-containing protein [Rhodospirillales bacterium]|nr:DUF1476 domain-containing protein [Rhodospirillales bacterium]